MTKKDDNLEEELKQEIIDMEEKDEEKENNIDNKKNNINNKENNISEEKESKENDEILKLKELVARTQADYQNYKTRTQRDKDDMVFFLKSKILKDIISRLDDIERIIKNTKDEEKKSSLFEAILVLEKSLKKDLENQWVKTFVSIWEEIDPNKHEVMTQIPWEKPWIIVDEFEKWYYLDNKVLRVAKVIVSC